MTKHRSLGRALGVALLATSAGACEFIDVTDSNPNAVPTATADQLFVGAQANTFFFVESQVARISSMWLQQMAGTDRQFAAIDVYTLRQSDADGEFAALYAQGGLLDLRTAQEQTERKVYQGILKIHEAHLIGMGASIWGAIPYSAAGDPENPGATLDEQEQVYAAVQGLLDAAIADLGTGTGAPDANVDLNFGGKAANWLAVAHTLKARFYMHWVEAQGAGVAAANTACGGNCLDKALQHAQQGIKTNAGTWRAVHGQDARANNLWYQFMRDRSGYISAGAFGVNLLQDRGDPRLPVFYSKGQSKALADVFIGSPPGNPTGDPGAQASALSNTGYGSPTFNMPIVSAAENWFIIAEAQARKGNTPAAQNALQQGVAAEEARLGVSGIPVDATLTGDALFAEIMTQKYLALFLHMEAWNDYKRTCLPAIQTFQGQSFPARLFYGETEAQTNPNIPRADQQPVRNANDPGGC